MTISTYQRERLAHYLVKAEEEAIEAAAASWRTARHTLGALRRQLRTLKQIAESQFGGKTGPQFGAALGATSALLKVRSREMRDAESALRQASEVLAAARQTLTGLATLTEPTAPAPVPAGTIPTLSQLKEQQDYLAAVTTYQIGHALQEETARRACDNIDRVFAHAATAMSGLHSEAVPDLVEGQPGRPFGLDSRIDAPLPERLPVTPSSIPGARAALLGLPLGRSESLPLLATPGEPGWANSAAAEFTRSDPWRSDPTQLPWAAPRPPTPLSQLAPAEATSVPGTAQGPTHLGVSTLSTPQLGPASALAAGVVPSLPGLEGVGTSLSTPNGGSAVAQPPTRLTAGLSSESAGPVGVWPLGPTTGTAGRSTLSSQQPVVLPPVGQGSQLAASRGPDWWGC